jgi:hypothetical protein
MEINRQVAGVPVGSLMHVHQAMVNVVENDLQNAHIMLKTGIYAFSGAVIGNIELKKRLTQNILRGMIIKAHDGVTSNIMLDFKSICSTSNKYEHEEGKFTGGAVEQQEQVRRSYRAAVQYLNLTENGNTPGSINPAEVILTHSRPRH